VHDRRLGRRQWIYVHAALPGPALAVCDFDNRTRTRDSIVQLHLPSYHPLSRNEER